MDGFRTPSSVKRRKSIKNTLRRITKPRLTLEDIFSSSDVAQCHTFPSHNRKRKDDRNLEQRLEMELKMRDGTAKLMAASLNPTMSLQAAKSMIASNERIVAYVHHLRSKISSQNEGSRDGDDHGNNSVEKEAKVSVSDIRIPLIWKDSAHFKNRGDYRRFAVFCLLRIGCEIYDTSLAVDVDPTVTDITFEDSIVFEKASPRFEMRLEVYCNLSSSDSRASSKRLQLGDSIGKAVGRKLAASLKDDLDADNTGPKYEMIAHATLRLADVNDGIKPHDLVLESTDRPFHHVPLFGHFCCRLAAQPDFLVEEELCFDLATVTGNGQCDISGQTLWVSLKGTTVTVWKDEARSESQLTLYLNQHTSVDLVDGNALTLTNLTGLQCEPYNLRFSVPETANKWVEGLRRQIYQSATWKNAAQIMDIPSPAPSRILPFGRRNFSLYEETRLKDSPVLPSGNVSSEAPSQLECFMVANCGSARETSV